MPDIVIVAVDNTAGTLSALRDAINKHTDRTAKLWLVNEAQKYGHDPGDIGRHDARELDDALEDCSVIHWNIHSPAQFCRYHNFQRHYKHKINVRHFHGSILRRHYVKDAGIFKCTFVSTPDLLEYTPKIGTYLPNVGVLPKGIKPRMTMPKTVTVGHHPTTRTTLDSMSQFLAPFPPIYAKGFPVTEPVKGTGYFSRAVNDLKNDGHDIILDMPGSMKWKDHVKWLKSISIYADQLWCGVYGVSTIEAMLMGKPALGFLSEYAERAMRKSLDLEIPILRTTHKTVKDDLGEIMYWDLKTIGKDSQAWAKTFHDPARIAKLYLEAVFG